MSGEAKQDGSDKETFDMDHVERLKVLRERRQRIIDEIQRLNEELTILEREIQRQTESLDAWASEPLIGRDDKDSSAPFIHPRASGIFDKRAEKIVLVVAESLMTRRLISKVLVERGFKILEAEDGAEALILLKKQLIGLVITDLQMPNVNGLELVEKIRENPRLTHISIIVNLTQSEKKEVHRLINLGVQGFLMKPLDPDALLTKIIRITES